MTARRSAAAAVWLVLSAAALAQTVPEITSDQSSGVTPKAAATANATGTYGDVMLEGDACCPTAGVLLRAKSARPSVAAQSATSDSSSGFSVFNSSNAELLRVQGDGAIVLGGATASAWHHILLPVIEYTNTSIGFGDVTDLHVNSNAFYGTDHVWRYKVAESAANYYLHRGTHNWRVAGAGAAGAALPWRQAMIIASNGDVGIGNGPVAPSARLQVAGGTRTFEASTVNGHGIGITIDDLQATEGYGFGALLNMGGNSMIRVSNLQIGYAGTPEVRSAGAPLRLNWMSAEDVVIGQAGFGSRLRVESSGTSTFGGSVSVAGDITASGSITGAKVLGATYQDLAEWVPADADLAPGTVVVLSRDRANAVTAATAPYDTTVAGVVSAQPGILLGEASSAKEMIATTGRVKVRVDASRNPIAIGDLLVSSDKPGAAMKSVPVDLGGIAIHRPGTIIGKALEAFPAGEGEILVLLSLQ